jgi:hypothetical protein
LQNFISRYVNKPPDRRAVTTQVSVRTLTEDLLAATTFMDIVLIGNLSQQEWVNGRAAPSTKAVLNHSTSMWPASSRNAGKLCMHLFVTRRLPYRPYCPDPSATEKSLLPPSKMLHLRTGPNLNGCVPKLPSQPMDERRKECIHMRFF